MPSGKSVELAHLAARRASAASPQAMDFATMIGSIFVAGLTLLAVFQSHVKGKMMRNVIRLGDATSHGGKVVSCRATHFRVKNIAVACVGDLCSCPIKGHNGCTIVSGSSRHSVNGVPIAFEDDVTSCGAKLKSSCGSLRST